MTAFSPPRLAAGQEVLPLVGSGTVVFAGLFIFSYGSWLFPPWELFSLKLEWRSDRMKGEQALPLSRVAPRSLDRLWSAPLLFLLKAATSRCSLS